ncbi:MAG: hypothetical protein KJ650_07205 [Firmicutes bacterium]|nr:hypothetical protein [Bacillota bacterium]MBV1734752.1 hypothetical protein [Desulforudis sp.]
MRETINRNLDFLVTVREDQWRNDLETDFAVATEPLDIDSCRRVLLSVAVDIRMIILERCGLTDYPTEPTDLTEAFEINVRILRLLKEYSGKLRRQIVLDYLREGIAENWEIVERANQNQAVIKAILLSGALSIELMKECLFMSSYESYAYRDYIMILDFEGVNDPIHRAHLQAVYNTGVNNPVVTTEQVEEILRHYERENHSGLGSTCRAILRFDTEILVFILRESQRNGLRTIQEFIVGTNAEYILLRFSLDLKQLKVRAIDMVHPDVFLNFAAKIAGSVYRDLPLCYVLRSDSNDEDTVNNAVHTMIEGRSPNISVTEIELTEVHLQGRPTITLKRTSPNVELVRAVDDDGLGFTVRPLLTNSCISKIKVSYTLNRQPHVFLLKFLLIEDHQIFVYVKGQGGGVRKRHALIEQLRSQLHLRVIE